MNGKLQKIGHIKLKGIHNEFLGRDILDYKLIFKHGIHPIQISSGIIRLNNFIYTDFKFSNQIREFGGDSFLFKINEYAPSAYDNIEISLVDNNKLFLSRIFFDPIKVNQRSFVSHIINGEKYYFSYDYNILDVNSIDLRMESLMLNVPNPGKYRLFMWCESNLGKMFMYNTFIDSNKIIPLNMNFILGNTSDFFIIKGEIFNSHEVSLIQFEKNLYLGNYEVKNENYKKENSSINLSYSVST